MMEKKYEDTRKSQADAAQHSAIDDANDAGDFVQIGLQTVVPQILKNTK